MSVREGSRYVRSVVVRTVDARGEISQPDFLDIEPEFDLSGRPDNRYIQAKASDGWANLGLHYLGDARAWWAIAAFSQVIDPFEELEAGANFVAPSTPYYHFVLTEKP